HDGRKKQRASGQNTVGRISNPSHISTCDRLPEFCPLALSTWFVSAKICRSSPFSLPREFVRGSARHFFSNPGRPFTRVRRCTLGAGGWSFPARWLGER